MQRRREKEPLKNGMRIRTRGTCGIGSTARFASVSTAWGLDREISRRVLFSWYTGCRDPNGSMSTRFLNTVK